MNEPGWSSETVGDPPLSRVAVTLLLGAAFVVVVAYVIANLGVSQSTARLLDNLHWISAHVAAATLAWMGVRAAGADDAPTRRWFAWGLTFYAVGEIVYGLQIATGWNPFPGPADGLTLLAGPCFWVGMLACLRSRTSLVERRRAWIDATAFSVAALALTLALYVPRRGSLEAPALAVMVAYPVGILTAACFGLMLVPTLRLHRNRGTLLMVASLFLMGLLWMRWNSLALDNRLEDGSWFNAVFSFGALGLGLGAMQWRSRPAAPDQWERRFEAGLRMLPLLVVIGSATAVVLVTLVPGLPSAVHALIGTGAVATAVLAVARQHLLLAERDRLLETERELREAEGRFRTLFESATDAIMLLGPSGFHDCNPSTLRLFRCDRGQIIGRTLADLSPEVQTDGTGAAEPARARIQAAMAGASQFFEWRLRRPDGSEFDAEVTLNRVGTSTHWLVQGIVRDISERKQAEATRQHLEAELQQALRLDAIGRLAGGVAHDFNNLLTVMLGTTELLMQELGAGAPGFSDLREIQRAGGRAAGLTAQLLAFSRKQVIAPMPLDLNQLLAGAVRMLERLLGEQVTLCFHPAPSLGTARVDPLQMEQVLMNLAVNARDAMPEGGTLTIETADVELDESQLASDPDVRPGPYIRVRVSDSGMGMDAETRAHLFEPFFTTKARGKGTGLGLSTTHGIIKQSGGLIVVDSLPGEGTTFGVYLPRVDERPAPVWQVPDVDARGRGETVLLVEDDEAVRGLAVRMLERLGYSILAVSRAEEAVELAGDDRRRIDLLLTDVILPSINGRQLDQALRATRPGLRTLFMSGYTSDIISRHGVLDPEVRFIEKPFTPESLGLAVRRALDGSAGATRTPRPEA